MTANRVKRIVLAPVKTPSPALDEKLWKPIEDLKSMLETKMEDYAATVAAIVPKLMRRKDVILKNVKHKDSMWAKKQRLKQEILEFNKQKR